MLTHHEGTGTGGMGNTRKLETMMLQDLLLTVLIGGMALLYASVGHAGSSGYQAAMGLMGLPPEVMKPTALFLNLVVATLGTLQFARAGLIRWRQLGWLVCTSIPMAFMGGRFSLPGGWYYLIVAVVLWLAAWQLWRHANQEQPATQEQSPSQQADTGEAAASGMTPVGTHGQEKAWPLVLLGAVLGLLSGLTGTGGGIFLTPALILGGWAAPREAAGTSVAFILVNSPAALLGWWQKQPSLEMLPTLLPWWMVLVAGCGWLGAWYGSRRGSPRMLRRLLALVLVIAGLKMVLNASH